ncbi:MAG: hypothetical protein HY275_18615 [Gemmatimonadetes bacterium]|nr:hypothetical protein [Gemmatimonadota bacterium]
MATGNQGTSGMTLDTLVARLREALGSALEAVVLFGSAAVDEHHGEHSDLNVLVLLNRLGGPELGGVLGAVTRDWAAAGQPAPLVMTTAEFRRSTDIFAMEIADILARHRVLHGTAPFAGLTVSAGDLRVQLEREAMGKLLKLRGAIMTAAGDADRQRQLLARSHSSFLVLFRALERLAGGAPAAAPDALIGAAAARVGFDPAPWLAVHRFRRGMEPLREPAATLSGVLAGAEKLAAFVDVYPAGG